MQGPGTRDPDELTANGIGSVIVGDGFLMVAVLLSVTSSPASSLFWLLLLIPAFFFFGKGFADVLHARQIRQRMKQSSLTAATTGTELAAPLISAINDAHGSGNSIARASATERTTRQLK